MCARVQLPEVDVKAFQNAGYNFEQIQEVQASVAEFNKTGKWYTLADMDKLLEKKLRWVKSRQYV